MAVTCLSTLYQGVIPGGAGYSGTISTALQFIAWWIALAQFITGLYALYLNPRYESTRFRPLAATSAFLIILAINTFAIGLLLGTAAMTEGAVMAGSSFRAQAELPAMLMAAVHPLIPPLFLLASILLLQPILKGRRRAVPRISSRRRAWPRWLQIPLYFIWSLPVWLTLVDRYFGTNLWYTGLPGENYAGGYLPLSQITGGMLHTLITTLNFTLPLIAAAILLMVASFRHLFDRSEGAEYGEFEGTTSSDVKTRTRRIAWAIFIVYLVSILLGGTHGVTSYSLPAALITSFLYLFAFAYATFQQIGAPVTTGMGMEPGGLIPSDSTTSEVPAERARLPVRSRTLEARLTILVLIVTLPLLAAMGVFLTEEARRELEQDAVRSLSALNQSVYNSTAIWLDYNQKALESLVNNPEIRSMDAARQKPLLQQMTVAYPQMYLVSTTDVRGINVARSDQETPKDYSDRQWFMDARIGVPVSYQTLLGRTSGQPAVVVSMPIRQPPGEGPSDTTGSSSGKIVGVGMFASDLDQVSTLVRNVSLSGSLAGENTSSIIYIVDQTNQLVAHPDPAQTAELKDMSSASPVKLLRQGETGNLRFTDENGETWRAAASLLPNGWGIVVQARERDLFAPIRGFQRLSLVILLMGAILLLIFAWLTIRQGLHPVQTLTATARAVTAGDLTRLSPIESQDELGVLAQAMNQMTTQLAELISGLEDRVAERTHDLERRAVQLQVAAEVAREASGLVGAVATPGKSGALSTGRQLEELLADVVNLISERFGHYHAGIFLLSESGMEASRSGSGGQDAILYAASSAGGKQMLARGHRLKVGQVGIVGYVASTGQPRIALDVGKDAVYFNNPDLPQTRSEIALPLKIGGGHGERVIGVLDVQSKKPSAFTQEDISVLQILADQLALAIQNVRLLTESQQALRELERMYGYQIRQGWQRRVAGQPLSYVLSTEGVVPAEERGEAAETGEAGNGGAAPGRTASGGLEKSKVSDENEIDVPIELRGQRLGVLHLRRGLEEGNWSPEERELLQKSMSQLALSLENARLLEEVQNRARQEELINQIVASTQSSLNLETVMRTAVQEVGQVLKVARVQLRLGAAGEAQASSEAQASQEAQAPREAQPSQETQEISTAATPPPASEKIEGEPQVRTQSSEETA
jgi:GAF domain-containing protein/HAMP domain-containing protein